jgi:hypothetical protein
LKSSVQLGTEVLDKQHRSIGATMGVCMRILHQHALQGAGTSCMLLNGSLRASIAEVLNSQPY